MGLVERYTSQLKALLPAGSAWPRDIGTNLHKFLQGVAEEAARIHDRAEDLLAEMDPSRTTELLLEWETVWGLPDPCTGTLETLQERRAALVARITSLGRQNPQFFIDLAASLGYAITIDENVGADPTVWRVNAPTTTIKWFRAGQSRAGEQVRTWGNELLECAIKEVNPAHLTVLFAYA